MPTDLVIAVGALIILALLRLRLILRRWQQVSADVVRADRSRRGQCRRLRELGRQSLHLKREVREAEAQVEQQQDRLDLVTERLAEARRRGARYTYVLDDRRTEHDTEFLVTLQNPHFDKILPQAAQSAVKSWREGRRFVVWALDQAGALEKVDRRFPGKLHYKVVAIQGEPAAEGASDPPPERP